MTKTKKIEVKTKFGRRKERGRKRNKPRKKKKLTEKVIWNCMGGNSWFQSRPYFFTSMNNWTLKRNSNMEKGGPHDCSPERKENTLFEKVSKRLRPNFVQLLRKEVNNSGNVYTLDYFISSLSLHKQMNSKTLTTVNPKFHF